MPKHRDYMRKIEKLLKQKLFLNFIWNVAWYMMGFLMHKLNQVILVETKVIN